jgi:hypothetical protein
MAKKIEKKALDNDNIAVDDEANELSDEMLNEEIVYFYVSSEQAKPPCEESISDEYMQKIILYGYVIVYVLKLKKNVHEV